MEHTIIHALRRLTFFVHLSLTLIYSTSFIVQLFLNVQQISVDMFMQVGEVCLLDLLPRWRHEVVWRNRALTSACRRRSCYVSDAGVCQTDHWSVRRGDQCHVTCWRHRHTDWLSAATPRQSRSTHFIFVRPSVRIYHVSWLIPVKRPRYKL